jgi:hypothetical protein
MSTWILDGNNVMGATIRGWWNDPAAAAARLTAAVARWCVEHPDRDVILVFDGTPHDAVAQQAGGNLRIEFAPRPKRDAADDRIVELVEELFAGADPDTTDGTETGLTVATSDRGLVDRLPPGVRVVGGGAFGRQLGFG